VLQGGKGRDRRNAGTGRSDEAILNDFGIVLPKGTRGLYKKSVFFDPHASEKDRVFVIEQGPGREPTPGSRKLTGFWESTGEKDSIDAYALESVMIGSKRVRQIVTGDPVPDPTPIVEVPDVDEPQAKVRRKR
jgi:hypothetical protein